MAIIRSQLATCVRQYLIRTSATTVQDSRPCSGICSRGFASTKDQKDDKAAAGTKKQEPASVGTDGGALGERSGPNKAATTNKKEQDQDKLEEDVVKGKEASKGTETAPWAS